MLKPYYSENDRHKIMTFIVGHKHMNLPKSIALTYSTILALSGNALCAIAPQTRSGKAKFAKTLVGWAGEPALKIQI